MTERTQRSNEEWLAELKGEAAGGADKESAHEALRGVVAAAVYKATAKKTGIDDAIREDLIQVALVHVLKNLDRFEGRSKFTTWVYAVAVRAAFTELRRSTYRSSGEELSEANQPDLEASAPAPESFAERSEIVEVMHRIIQEELTERQRIAILGELNDTPKEELLETLGGNRNALYKLVHDARKKLKEGLLTSGICDTQVREAFDL